jgi:single-strand DNA-binding protein
MALPQLTATGNLTRDPELRHTQSGTAVASFTVACNKKRKNDDGKWEDVASCFLNCTVWDRDADAAVEVLAKGDQVTVVGSLRQRDYVDKDDNKRTAYEVDVYTVAKVVRARLADREKPGQPPVNDPWATQENKPKEASTPAAADPWAAPAGAEPPF